MIGVSKAFGGSCVTPARMHVSRSWSCAAQSVTACRMVHNSFQHVRTFLVHLGCLVCGGGGNAVQAGCMQRLGRP